MKKIITILIFIFTLSLMSISCASNDSENPENLEAEQNLSYEKEIMELINQYRVKNGKNRLESSNFLKTQTDKHSNYMVKKKDLSHDLWDSRFADIKNEWKTYSTTENVAVNMSTKAEKVVNQWINSSGHRRNMLADNTHFYVSAKKGEWNGYKNAYFYTAIFSTKNK